MTVGRFKAKRPAVRLEFSTRPELIVPGEVSGLLTAVLSLIFSKIGDEGKFWSPERSISCASFGLPLVFGLEKLFEEFPLGLGESFFLFSCCVPEISEISDTWSIPTNLRELDGEFESLSLVVVVEEIGSWPELESMLAVFSG